MSGVAAGHTHLYESWPVGRWVDCLRRRVGPDETFTHAGRRWRAVLHMDDADHLVPVEDALGGVVATPAPDEVPGDELVDRRELAGTAS